MFHCDSPDVTSQMPKSLRVLYHMFLVFLAVEQLGMLSCYIIYAYTYIPRSQRFNRRER